MKSLKKNFRGIFVLERDLVGKSEPKCDHNFSIPGRPDESIGLKFIPSQSELFWFILISVSEPMRIIPNQSEKRFVSGLMKNDQKSIRLDQINCETSIRMNTKPSLQSRSIRSRIDPKRIFNQNQYESFRPWINSDWFWLKIRFESIRARIGSD